MGFAAYVTHKFGIAAPNSWKHGNMTGGGWFTPTLKPLSLHNACPGSAHFPPGKGVNAKLERGSSHSSASRRPRTTTQEKQSTCLQHVSGSLFCRRIPTCGSTNQSFLVREVCSYTTGNIGGPDLGTPNHILEQGAALRIEDAFDYTESCYQTRIGDIMRD